jgi:hypothetical protein
MILMRNLDWNSWLYGLAAGFVAGGSGAVSAAFTLMVTDPDRYNLANPWKILTVMFWTFFLPGMVAAFSYLKQNPLPVEVKTTVETVEIKPPGIVKTTVETKETHE